MIKYYQIADGKLMISEDVQSPILVFIDPTDVERKRLMEEFKIDEYDINSALDPNEPARLEFDDRYTTIILNAPKRYSAVDNFLFKIASFGIFLQNGRMVILLSDDLLNFEGRVFTKIHSLQSLLLRFIYRNVIHFEQHLQAIEKISEDLEHQITKSMENKYLLNMFNLEKSLVYYMKAISSNGRIIDKIRVNAAKFNFTPVESSFIEDVVTENSQCSEQAHIFSEVFSNLMDAWASIINNNLSVFIKKLSLATICLMLPTMILSIFSINMKLPFDQSNSVAPFWIISTFATLSSVGVFALWRWKKW